jgi:hypothetical protein
VVSPIAAAERLAKDTPFARVDFYEIEGKPLFDLLSKLWLSDISSV